MFLIEKIGDNFIGLKRIKNKGLWRAWGMKNGQMIFIDRKTYTESLIDLYIELKPILEPQKTAILFIK